MDEQTKAKIEAQLIRRLSENVTESKELYALVGTHIARVNIWVTDGTLTYNIEWLDVKRFALDNPLEDLCLAQDAVDLARNNLSIAKQNAKRKTTKENTLVLVGNSQYIITSKEAYDYGLLIKSVENLTTSDSWAIQKGN